MFDTTPSQQVAIEAFKGFLEAPSQVFILKGAAGTGKTVLAKMFIDILCERQRGFRLMAPTGHAAFIIGNKTGHEAFTIHKSIYGLSQLNSHTINEEENDDNLHARFALKKNEDSINYIYFVDEASMVSDNFSDNEAFSFGSGQLLHDLFNYANGRKLVFIGDYAQLPPVGMNFSPALDVDYLKNEFKADVVESKLTEIVRQDHNSEILKNATRIRQSIDTKTFVEFRLSDANDFHADNDNLLSHYYELSPSKPSVNAAIIAYSNKQVLQYNNLVRAHYFGVDAPRLVSGELLIIARNNYAYDVELFNGNIVMVDSCQADSEVEQRTVRVKTGKDKVESVNLCFRQATIKLKTGNEIKELNVKLLDNFLVYDSSSVSGLLARALVVDFNNRLPKEIKDNLPAIKKALRGKSELLPQLKELYKIYIDRLFTDPYYNSVICKYGYALTCHKAQGGEWDSVYVDMGRFGGTANEDYFRWAYTALTRASKQVWHYRSPDFDYISNIVVEPIQKSSNIKVSTYSGNSDFCESRFSRIDKIAKSFGVNVIEDKSRDYQHWITFSNQENNIATFILWYNKAGYNGKEVLHNSTSQEFTTICVKILGQSFAPGVIPFNAPNRPFAEKLNQYILSLIHEIGIQLLDITQDQYHDTYHLKTDGIAKLEMYYTGNGNYSYMRAISSIGSDDLKLEELRKRFI